MKVGIWLLFYISAILILSNDHFCTYINVFNAFSGCLLNHFLLFICHKSTWSYMVTILKWHLYNWITAIGTKCFTTTCLFSASNFLLSNVLYAWKLKTSFSSVLFLCSNYWQNSFFFFFCVGVLRQLWWGIQRSS